jgi:hypothetical protein
MTMTATELRKAEAAYRTAFARSEQKREARNQAIRRAVASGMRQSEVAHITGLAKQRIGQIVNNGGEA